MFEYGFEDWAGDADSTQGYPFAAPDETYWNTHKANTMALDNCGGWRAFSGNNFLYGNWYAGASDPCLNNGGGSPVLHIGADWNYGNNADFVIPEHITGNEMYVRFKICLGAGWKTNTQHLVKFFRPKWAGGGLADFYSNVIMYSGEGNYFTTGGYDESLWAGSCDLDELGIDLSDGNWHDFAVWEDISRLRESMPGPLRVKIWVDGHLIIDRDVPINSDYILQYDSVGFDRFILLENFCGTVNTGPVTFGFDDLEIWDGIPTSDNLPPAEPAGLTAK